MSSQVPLPSAPSPIPDRSTLHKARHIKYWLRCLKTHLPTAYTPNDSQRITLAFFILSALDLLGVLHEKTTPAERKDYVEWILRCQHPGGGFRGFTGTMYGDNKMNGKNDVQTNEWDSANLAATYFALAALIVLGEGMERVRRKETLAWVRSLQRPNGSFGEGTGKGGQVKGSEDMRFCLLAAGVRWSLRRGKMEEEKDIDVEGVIRYIEASVTYEGGIAQAPFHEAHAGLTYSGVGALQLLGRLPRKGNRNANVGGKMMSPQFVENMTMWLVSRQTLMLEETEDGLVMTEDEMPSPLPTTTEGVVFPPSFHVQGALPVSGADISHHKPQESYHESTNIEVSSEDMQWVGVNGRCNKVADTCYTFWVGGTLGILNKVYLQDFNGIRRFLLEKTQHPITGGFGKMPGDLPDILHSYLGLATLATMREPDLKSIDPTLCISISARDDFEQRMGKG